MLISASPQILYQRPYDPLILPIQNQQVAIANTPPILALSQPSYAPAPARIAPAAPSPRPLPGPTMFRNALVRVNIPICLIYLMEIYFYNLRQLLIELVNLFCHHQLVVCN